MQLLIVVCVLTVVGGVPINTTQEATSHAPVSVVPSNNTQNVITSSPATGGVAVMPGPQQYAAETLEELEGDVIVHEGDIVMSAWQCETEGFRVDRECFRLQSEPAVKLHDDRNAVESIWSDAIVPYTIGDELAPQELKILNSFKMISDVTCIRFIQRTTESNYLLFTSGTGCASYVGCQGGVQLLYDSKSCSLGNLCHEIIHALGLHHEHTREDRDHYISVQQQNIIPGREKNFMVKHGNAMNLPYDLESIMHYGDVNGYPTVLSKQNEVLMGQRTHLSNLDILKLNKLYKCEEGNHE